MLFSPLSLSIGVATFDLLSLSLYWVATFDLLSLSLSLSLRCTRPSVASAHSPSSMMAEALA